MFKKIVFLLFFIILFFWAWFYYKATRSPSGPPNPPFSSTASCGIQIDGNENYVVFCGGQEYLIAQSNEDLAKYVNKRVHIQATYLMNPTNTDALQTNIQCVGTSCRPLFKNSNQKMYAIVI
ncbi:MAG TPA: hypothetical protein VLF89_05810, partial [Candidatus Saccharimonadales bacterium]|nr:hypothetical protein [Candidatus Saccharimonadales bacterium]